MDLSDNRDRLVLLDLDDTIFDATAFKRDLPMAVESAFEIPASEFGAQISAHYDVTPQGESIGYNIFKHLKEYDVDLAIDESRDLLIKTMFVTHEQNTNGQPDFLYPDVREALMELRARERTYVEGWSINNPSCLHLKQVLCGSTLEGIAFKQLTGNKGHYLQKLWRRDRLVYGGIEYYEAVVLDDKADQIEAVPKKENVTRVQIVRPGQKYPANVTGIPCIASFDELLTFPRVA